MKRRQLLKHLAASIPAVALAKHIHAADNLLNSNHEFMASAPFKPSWDSLSSYQAPDWFRNAKFGIWSHWGPQCQPERGDWYARGLYEENSDYYKWHVAHYGHPSKAGFKEVIHNWKAENWDPEKLVALYKRAGAQYFFAMANHHDNLDLWDSKYQPWNSVRVGPKKNIVAGWAKAAKKHSLPFGLSVHAAHAWMFYETSQVSDKSGQFAGVPYDGNLTKADGKGTWWEGLDPQELYAQNHKLSKTFDWDWKDKTRWPSPAYCERFYKRTMDLIKQYNPDLIYFDDSSLPLYPVSDVGLRFAANYYNQNMATHNGKLEAVLFGKKLTDTEKKCMVWDVERGVLDNIQAHPWQTCSCIGNWHYDSGLYERGGYKSTQTVVQMLVDIVSKNGNLLLNIPVRGDGTIDEKEVAIVEGIGAWMDINSESIFGTRPWKVFGEGPATGSVAVLSGAGFNEGKGKSFGASDIRFTTKNGLVYATVLGWPENGQVLIKTMKSGNPNQEKAVSSVEMLGDGQKLKFNQTNEGLLVKLSEKPKLSYAFALKIS
ncbi:alpha-L-fucosidase [Mucilaginibacter sp. R-33]|uniref:alpha-L-fucosidase n=1 Tax=Mucilaginibacter sp. R-33 TaxID=3416711 RepID=UPI003CFAE84A